jgi:tRNA pseudouridine55 synthase
LVVAVGQATRLIDYVQRMPKRYRAEFRLGCTSPTEDVDSEVAPVENPHVPTCAEIDASIPHFSGEILQTPPAFSALKIEGRRAYELARKGEEVELKPRPVVIHQLRVLSYDYPTLRLEIECSSGTYVRSLGRDLAVNLGTGAVMSALVRTAIGRFQLPEAIDVTLLSRENLVSHLLPPQKAVDRLPTVTVDRAEQEQLARGQPIACTCPVGEHSECAALDDCGNLTAILCRREDGLLWPTRNFLKA